MINTKLCRQNFLSILRSLDNIDNNKQQKQIRQQINLLKDYIDKEYLYDKELPKISHQFIEQILMDIEEIDVLLGKYTLSLYYELPYEAEQEKAILKDKASILIKKYTNNNKVYAIDNSLSQLDLMLNKYYRRFGVEVTKKAFEGGLDILNKEKQHLFINDKTNKNSINNLISKYPANVIEKYLCKSLISNIIFQSKNLQSINTQRQIEQINIIRKEV